MNDWGATLIQITNLSPTFKGAAVTIVGLLALLFASWMHKRWQEPLKGGFLVFIGISIFIVFYGLFLLIMRPEWWKLPY
ncbi:hypothetical protein A2291_06260 [candidate division WOR-1 bacterium RIFOXYB2_FULL_42_35]|uniref:Uncharacterized protein n=1 Tax=candidate division WOR-1 bacterium RIFOXYC2_FULL_41_25 TaxID=1802586 RepID=A0A1F4TJ41_UNCSA|nr:MAG: hypothetical protein A2247_07810 [candidate division WOR-1 bacterium RIFOXYA2_FULL_41_14]OGC21624.1 MAG: hypothetical protein A2291_06260 [candidate division WOR-1 bacterium RIFOXYB2_FULL_42_35]OGC32627.1 MAG: hypothetical protein A2462_02020 [candidate division WOR-1 bacterium RIFOXYC2_FULL_41_25]